MSEKPHVFVTRLVPEAGLGHVRELCDADVWEERGPPARDVLLERVALLESTLGSQRMTIALAGRRTAEGRDDEGRAPLWSAVRTSMRLNDEQGFRAGLDSAAGSGTSGR